MQNKLKQAWTWLVTSSEDPQKLSLTLKHGLPFLVSVLAYTKYNLSLNDLTGGVDGLVMVLTGLGTLYGFSRKLYHLAYPTS